MERNRYIHYGLVLTALAFLSALTLAYVNGVTASTIADNAKKVVQAARIKVLPVAKSFSEEELKEANGLKFIPGKDDNGAIVGYVVSASENGYAGPIDFVLGFDKDGKITGLDIVGSQETPGLGSKIMNQTWKDIWVGRDSQYKFNKSVDAFAGATISPEATYKGIIRVLDTYEKEVK